jgi:hypothetical protein
MARDTDTPYKLDKPEKLDDLLKADRAEDCTSCRAVGTYFPDRSSSLPPNTADAVSSSSKVSIALLPMLRVQNW